MDNRQKMMAQAMMLASARALQSVRGRLLGATAKQVLRNARSALQKL